MPHQIAKDLSASTLQVITNQVLGLAIFYLLSVYLPKNDFGNLNWWLAACSMPVAIAGFGIDLVVVRRIAAGGPAREAGGLHFMHSLVTAFFFLLIFFLLICLLPGLQDGWRGLTGIALSMALTYLASPFKQIVYGTRQFHLLALMSTILNAARFLLLLFLAAGGSFSMQNVILAFLVSAVFEFLASGMIVLQRINLFPLFWSWKEYKKLVREAVPQFVVTVFNTALARFDWILLGIVSTSLVTADYIFAFRLFELSKLPLMIISPVLLPVFVKLFNTKNISPGIKKKAKLLFDAELFISVFLPLLVAVLWMPLISGLTGEKYGEQSRQIFLILSVCVPLQFVTDYYWNICFAQGRLKVSMNISIASSVLNIVCNLLFVPVFGVKGAAVSYLLSYVLQVFLFRKYTDHQKIRPDLAVVAKAFVSGLAALAICLFFISNVYLAALMAVVFYFSFSWMTGNLDLRKIKSVYQLLIR